MFIRKSTKTVKGKKYRQCQLMHSVRTPQGPRQKLILNLGIINLPEEQWKSLANAIEAKLYNNPQKALFEDSKEVNDLANHFVSLINENNLNKAAITCKDTSGKDYEKVDINSIKLSNSTTVGSEHIVNSELNNYKFDNILEQIGFNAKEKQIAKLLIGARLIHPASERETARWLNEDSAFIELINYKYKMYDNALHRVANKLFKNKDYLEKALAQKAKSLFNLKETVFLYDLTNTFFESPKRDSKIAKYGRSKEKRYDAPLVTLALTVDEEGFPKKSEIYKGNISEPETLKDILKEINPQQISFNPENTPTLVFDAGIASQENLDLIKSYNCNYLAVSRKRTYDEKLWEFAKEREIKLANGKIDLKIKRALNKGEAFLLCESKNKQLKEQAIQTRKIQNFEKGLDVINLKLTKPKTVKNYEKVIESIGRLKEKYKVGALYEIEVKKNKKDNTVTKILYKQVKDFDKTPGEYVIRTDRIDLTDEQISKIHRSLTRVEGAFRVIKQETGLRPNYHRVDNTMKSHIFISVLAYYMISGITKKLRDSGVKHSWGSVRNIMSTHTRVTSRMVTDESEVITLRDCVIPTLKQTEIYNALRLVHNPLLRRKYKSKKCSHEKD